MTGPEHTAGLGFDDAEKRTVEIFARAPGQRATIISLDSMFANLGGVIGQSGWGWLARMRSIGEAWAYSGATLLLGLPLYWLARRGESDADARVPA